MTRFWLPEDGLRNRAAHRGQIGRSGVFYHHIRVYYTTRGYSAGYGGGFPRVRLKLLAYDRWRIHDIQWELDNLGAHVPMTPFGQGFKHRSPANDKVERFTAERKLCHSHNTILNMYAAVAVIKSDPVVNRKLHKAKSYPKIDGLVDLAMALGCMSVEETLGSSPWDNPEFNMAF